MSEQKYKLDIFKILDKLSLKDREFFQQLSEEDIKSLHPLVLMRWMSGTAEARQVFFLNELVNTMVFLQNVNNEYTTFTNSKHKMLWLYLLMISGPGKARRYTWLKAKGKKTSNTPKALALVKQHFSYNTAHALDALKILTNEQILELAEYYGKQPDEIKELSKELKGREILVDE